MSLIEVVLALGIISFAIVPLIGLTGIGLSSQTAANEDTAKSAILAFMQNEVRSRPFSTNAWTEAADSGRGYLTDTSRVYYFDVRGNWVTNGTPAGIDESRSVYEVRFHNSGATSSNHLRYGIRVRSPYPSFAKSEIIPATLFGYD